MVISSLIPNIMVEDIERTVEWYEEIFDAEVVATLPEDEGEPWWAQIVIGGITMMFQTAASLVDEFPEMEGESGPGSATMYIKVSDIRHLYDDLQDKEVTFVQELTESAYGRNQFAIQDCNDYILWFGAEITNEPEGPIIR